MQEVLQQALIRIPPAIPISTACLYTNDPSQYAYCCIYCRAEICRIYIAPIRKYVIPSCTCRALHHDKERDKQVRRELKMQLDQAYRQNIMNEKLKSASFNNFLSREGTEKLYASSVEFAKYFEEQEQGLFSFGVPGNGKSHLAAAIHHYLEKQEYTCLFIDFSQLTNIVRDSKKYSSKVMLSSLISAAIQADLFTLDEIGNGALTQDDYKDILLPIINGREGKLTNYTTNLDLNELRSWLQVDMYGKPLDVQGRVLDRLLGSCKIIRNSGTSKRQEDAIKRRQCNEN